MSKGPSGSSSSNQQSGGGPGSNYNNMHNNKLRAGSVLMMPTASNINPGYQKGMVTNMPSNNQKSASSRQGSFSMMSSPSINNNAMMNNVNSYVGPGGLGGPGGGYGGGGGGYGRQGSFSMQQRNGSVSMSPMGSIGGSRHPSTSIVSGGGRQGSLSMSAYIAAAGGSTSPNPMMMNMNMNNYNNAFNNANYNPPNLINAVNMNNNNNMNNSNMSHMNSLSRPTIGINNFGTYNNNHDQSTARPTIQPAPVQPLASRGPTVRCSTAKLPIFAKRVTAAVSSRSGSKTSNVNLGGKNNNNTSLGINNTSIAEATSETDNDNNNGDNLNTTSLSQTSIPKNLLTPEFNRVVVETCEVATQTSSEPPIFGELPLREKFRPNNIGGGGS